MFQLEALTTETPVQELSPKKPLYMLSRDLSLSKNQVIRLV